MHLPAESYSIKSSTAYSFSNQSFFKEMFQNLFFMESPQILNVNYNQRDVYKGLYPKLKYSLFLQQVLYIASLFE